MSYPRKDYDREQAKKLWSIQEAKIKIASFCAYQERCQEEVRKKLNEKGIFGLEAEGLISEMIAEGFLNEERFAKAYVRGKFGLKKWGRYKITNGLKSKQISSSCIRIGLKEIEEEEYLETMIRLGKKKWSLLKPSDKYQNKNKLRQYLLSKGFENELIEMEMESMISDQNL